MKRGGSLGPPLGAGVGAALVATALVTYVGSHLGGRFSIWVVDLLLWGGLSTAVVVTVVRSRRSREDEGSARDRDARGRSARARSLVPTVLPAAALLPGVVALVTSPRLQMSFHGYMHSAYTYQALEGNLPPENPLLAGTPANDYWLFHVFLAGISHVLRIAPPVAGLVVNFAALGACLGAIAWLLKRLDLLPRRPILGTCAVLFVLFGANLAGSAHAGIASLAGQGASDPVGISTMVLSGVARSAGLFPKFLNFNGFPLGIAFFLLALAGAVVTARRVTLAALTCFALGILGALAFHITTGLFALATLSLAAPAGWALTRSRPTGDVSRRAGLAWTLLWICGLAVMGHYVMTIDDALAPGAHIDLWNPDNLRRFLGVTYPLLPFFVAGTIHALRKRRAGIVALAWVGTAGTLASCITVLPDDNQYKFDYLTGIALAVVALGGLRWLASLGPAATGATKFLAAAGTALIIFNLTVQGFSYARSDLAAQDTVAYEGVNVVGESHNSGAWEWIRTNTATDSVVVTPLLGANRAPVLAMSRRPVYVLDGGPFTEKTEFDRRSLLATALYASGTPLSEWLGLLEEIRDDLGDRPGIVAVPMGHDDVAHQRGLSLVYDKEGVKLYSLMRG